MKHQITENVVKWILILSIFIVTSLRSCLSHAQDPTGKHGITYLGFDAAFGIRSFTLRSSIDNINGMKVLEEGGSLGLLVGNKMWQAKIRQGFFSSAACVPYTTDLIETEANVNVNPLQIIKTRFRSFEPYVTAGIERDAVKLYGTYLSKDRAGETRTISYSSGSQPYLGQIVATRASLGAGLQYRIPYQNSFLRLFTETRYGYAIDQRSRSSWFKHTSLSGAVAVSVGVCFGYLNK